MRTLIVTLALVAAGCGKDAASTAPVADTAMPAVDVAAEVAVEDAPQVKDVAAPTHAGEPVCEAIVSGYCGLLAKCKSLPTIETILRYCADPVDVVCAREMVDIETSIANGAIAVSETKLAECQKAVAAQPCIPGVGFVTDPFVCTGFAGQIAVGKPCNRDLECVDGAYCEGTDKACPGTCAALPGVGSPCATNYRCATGGYCWQNVCKAQSTLGGACTDPNECAMLGLVCQGGKCVVSKAGDSCANDSECSNMPFGMTCHKGVCVERGKVGAPCANTVEPAYCDSDSYCDMKQHPDGEPTLGTCIARGKEGTPCTSASQCVSGSKCIVSQATGKKACFEARGIGEPCAQGEPCDGMKGLVCTAKDKICGPPPKVGESCFVTKTGLTPCAYGSYCQPDGDAAATCTKPHGAGEACIYGVGSQSGCATGLVCQAPPPPATPASATCVVSECTTPHGGRKVGSDRR